MSRAGPYPPSCPTFWACSDSLRIPLIRSRDRISRFRRPPGSGEAHPVLACAFGLVHGLIAAPQQPVQAFPFVEPGFELDLQCVLCGGHGCSTCGDGWIELIPCGLVHPRVLEYGRIDTSVYSGFAFGLGLTRLAMMKFGVPDSRLFNSGDIRFYEQFPAAV